MATQSWICTVCGYVHQGDEAPDVCPVCGATKDLFEPYEEPKVTAQSIPSQWRCMNCEYIHEDDEPPEICPVCGAPASRFEAYFASETQAEGGETGAIVIVGAGIAGVSAAQAARKASPKASVTLISKEQELPYYRLNLTRYLAGEITADQLPLHPEDWYSSNKIDLQLGTELCTVEPDTKTLHFRGAESMNYDQLILAIGSHPFVPPFPGANKENVTALRTKADANLILEQSSSGARCVVIGGGLLGLETAGALARKDIDVTLLEGHGWLLPRQLNETGGKILEQKATELGIKLVKNARTKELVGDERVRDVLLENGDRFPAELVIIATGVRSNTYLARRAGLEVDHGIVVNNTLRTSHESIFAVGDVCEHFGMSYGTWGPAQFQGTIAGMNSAGGSAEFAGIPRSNMLKVLGHDMFSIGTIRGEDASYRAYEAEDSDNYFFFLFRDSHMQGAILLGDTSLSAQVKHTVETKVDCSGLLQKQPSATEILDHLRDAS